MGGVYLFVLLLAFAASSSCNMIEKKGNSPEIHKKNPIDEEDKDNDEHQEKKRSTTVENILETNSAAEILNGIIVHETGGLEISRAYLSYDDNTLVPKTNHINVNQPVYLNLNIKKGWKITNGTVSIDASEKIITDAGEPVLNAMNLFKANPQIDEKDANHIYLKAHITKTRSDINYFIIRYKLWDKNGDGKVEGSYKLFVNNVTE